MTRKPATDQEIAAVLTRLRACAAQTREALRDLMHVVDSADLSLTFSKLATLDGQLGQLMQVDHRAVAIERKPLKRRTKKPNKDA